MEISAVSASKAVPSTLPSSFSDQSHLQFYGRGRSSFLTPSNLRFKVLSCRSSASRSVIAPIRCFSGTASDVATEPVFEEALMKELAELKLQMKQKKKELKAHMKEDKKKLKDLLKEEKKKKKQKDEQEGKMKMKCDSESSMSSSESCGEECASVSMKTVRESRSMLGDNREISEGGPPRDDCVAGCTAVSSSGVQALPIDEEVAGSGKLQTSSSLSESDLAEVCSGKYSMSLSDRERIEKLLGVAAMGSFNGCASDNGDLPCKSRVDGGFGAAIRTLSPPRSANRIEVCAGGKCKKAGSQQLLLALKGQIPRTADVEAVPCKCMGKCAMAVNVRVLKEDTNPQHHSHVGVEDGSLILSHHFGIGSPAGGIPSLLPREGIREPSRLLTA